MVKGQQNALFGILRTYYIQRTQCDDSFNYLLPRVFKGSYKYWYTVFDNLIPVLHI